MTDKNTPQPVLTDLELLDVGAKHGRPSVSLLPMWRAVEAAVLSKLRAPVADERAAFEAWATTAIAEKYDVTRNGDHYMEPYTEWAWEVWQARAALAAQAPAANADALDAARYRWLRGHFRFAADSECEIWFDGSLKHSPADQLDAAIDAALAAQVPQQGEA